MTKIICLLVVICSVSFVFASELKMGDKASDWNFKDATEEKFTMESWGKKVLLINYVDPDEADLNEHFTDAVKKALDAGRLNKEKYKGFGIVDTKATWKPNFIIRAIAKRKKKKYNTVILFDYEASLRKAWGLKKDTHNVIIVDKRRVCRYIQKGKVPENKVNELVGLLIKLQNE